MSKVKLAKNKKREAAAENAKQQTQKPAKRQQTKLSKRGKELVKECQEYEQAINRKLKKLSEYQHSAFDTMFNWGKWLLERQEEIQNEFGSFNKFAKHIGSDSSTVSRAKKSYEDFARHGATTPEMAKQMLHSRQVQPSAKLLERNISKLLTDETANEDIGSQKGKNKARQTQQWRESNQKEELKQYIERTQEIVDNHDPDDEIYETAVEAKRFAEESLEYLESLEITQRFWKSEDYLASLRKMGKDMVTGEIVGDLEVHHMPVEGGTAGQGEKASDVLAVPVSRETHRRLHSGELELSREERLEALMQTMAHFIVNSIPSDETEVEYEDITDEQEEQSEE